MFIFGGPGTQKGRYIDALVDLYGLQCITICKVLQEEVGDEQVYDVTASKVRDIPLQSVLQWVGIRLHRGKNAPGFVIDIVPNIKVGRSEVWALTDGVWALWLGGVAVTALDWRSKSGEFDPRLPRFRVQPWASC